MNQINFSFITVLILDSFLLGSVNGFSTLNQQLNKNIISLSKLSRIDICNHQRRNLVQKTPSFLLSSVDDQTDQPSIKARALEPKETILDSLEEDLSDVVANAAATNTINERLIAEAQAQQDNIKNGPKSSLGKKLGKAFVRPQKSDEERQRDLEEARNLNGLNPITTIFASFFALGAAYYLWNFTTFLGDMFLSNPIESDLYVVNRLAGVFRNVVMGLFSLMSGFFGVIGLGVFMLGVRVAYGVVTGELDPTPIVQPKRPGIEEEKFDLPNAWDLMTGNTKSKRRK